MDSGSAIPSTDRYELYRIAVDLPSLEEQQKAVAILTTIDDKLRLNREIWETACQDIPVIETFCKKSIVA